MSTSPSGQRAWQTSRLVFRLARTNMTVISAVTHLTASIMSTSARFPISSHQFSLPLFLRSWMFILVTQFATHFLGEVFDFKSDSLNRHATPMTGGSKVLVEGRLSQRFALRLAVLTILFDIFLIFTVVPINARPLAIVMLAMAYSYSAPPLSLNFRGWGELDAAIITSFLVPHFAAVSQGVAPIYPLLFPPLTLLVVPPFLNKIALFLLLNMADRRPDWAGGKITLAVILGHAQSARLHAVLMAAAYISAILIILFGHDDADSNGPYRYFHLIILFFLIPSARLAYKFSTRLLQHKEFRMDWIIPPALFHSTVLVWSILVHALFLSFPFRGIFQSYIPFIIFLAYLSVRNYMRGGKKKTAASTRKRTDEHEQSSTDTPVDIESRSTSSALPPINGNNSQISNGNIDTSDINTSEQETAAAATTTTPLSHDVLVIGGGISGLVSALTLDAQGLRVQVLERREQLAAQTGADVALWPGAIRILRRLGIPSSFFDSECFALHQVHMCNMQFSRETEKDNIEDQTFEPALRRPVAEVLKTIDMDAVTEGTGEHFVLVSRQALMSALWKLVPSNLIICDADVTRVTEYDDDGFVRVVYVRQAVEHSATARVVIAADGARSRTRALIDSSMAGSAGIQFRGEVCYRGVLHANEVSDDVRALLPDSARDGTMRINYGAGLRSSFGYMSGDGNIIYWWVKVITSQSHAQKQEHRQHLDKQQDEAQILHDDGADAVREPSQKLSPCTWPSPLKELHDATPEHAFYVHDIEDGAQLTRWSSMRVALVGDAAHLVTPNMGQGACMATEDAFVLSVLLAKYWQWPDDGHTEAFYEYERVRKPFAQAVAADARKQLFLGQLTSSWMVWLRETLLRVVPVSVLQKTLRRNNFPVEEYIEQFDTAVRTK